MNKKGLFLYLFLVLCLFFTGLYLAQKQTVKNPFTSFFSLSPTQTILSPAPVASLSAELAVVKRVVDGDTIELVDGRKVRYIGVDTPELHHPTKGIQCFGQEAMKKNKELVEGKEIRMIKDVSETDRYKRLLRYVYVGNLFVNEYLAQEGFAFQATFPPDVKYTELFRQAAEVARVNERGLWKKCR